MFLLFVIDLKGTSCASLFLSQAFKLLALDQEPPPSEKLALSPEVTMQGTGLHHHPSFPEFRLLGLWGSRFW